MVVMQVEGRGLALGRHHPSLRTVSVWLAPLWPSQELQDGGPCAEMEGEDVLWACWGRGAGLRDPGGFLRDLSIPG